MELDPDLRWYPDPTGRFALRGAIADEWSDLVRESPTGRIMIDDLDQQPQVAHPVGATGVSGAERLFNSLTRDSLGEAVSFAGWVGVVLALIAGIAVGTEEWPTNMNYGVAVAVVGTLQAVLLVAFGRMLRYLKACAALLAKAVAGQS